MTIDFLEHVRSESARFLSVLERTDPAARVPACPDWTAADLLWHLGEVQWFWGTIVRDRVQDPGPIPDAERPETYAQLLDFYRTSSSDLVTALESTADDVEVWTWFARDQSAGFVRRRQAHEALIHRLDAELTAGEVTEVDPALASDGVLEVLEWMYSGVPAWASHEQNGAIGAVSTTDTGERWLVQLGTWSGHSPDSGNTYTDEPTITVVDAGDPTFEVSAGARDLDAWLWNRPTQGEITKRGDTAPFEAVLREGVQ